MSSELAYRKWITECKEREENEEKLAESEKI